MAFKTTGPAKSAADLIKDTNLTGKVVVAKTLYASDPWDDFVPKTPLQATHDARDYYPPVEEKNTRAKKADTAPSMKASSAVAPTKKNASRFQKQVVSIRLDEDVMEAWKEHQTKHTTAMAALIEKYAHDQGWL